MSKESDYVTLKKGGDLKVIYTIAGYEVGVWGVTERNAELGIMLPKGQVQTKVGESLAHFVKQFDLGISDLNLEKLSLLRDKRPKNHRRSRVGVRGCNGPQPGGIVVETGVSRSFNWLTLRS